MTDTAVAAAVLDDFDSRPGRSMSLLRTIVGGFLRELGGWMPTAGAVTMLDALEVPASTARSTLTRLAARGVLAREPRDGVAGYVLRAGAVPMLERGDARIFQATASADEGWCLVSFSIPERHRDRRHQLRRRLDWIGCGTVSDALWIGPERVADDVRDILADLQLTGEVTVFTGARPLADRPLAELAGRWWDLERVRMLHQGFLDRYAPVVADAGALADRAAFATWVGALDEWRVIPYLDPGLPASALPVGWPGPPSRELFAVIRERYADAALGFARRVTGCGR
ncbi:PaaX family transcriptional regulator C-terminal domain-containing protein [Diaminobutyricibacter sp. McL0618]|uniref:PaaX family transcriptional regulator n=1 Tax=Leifsonia sp. McL0618 TaxID=3415677 RepID=UPI003CF04D09